MTTESHETVLAPEDTRTVWGVDAQARWRELSAHTPGNIAPSQLEPSSEMSISGRLQAAPLIRRLDSSPNRLPRRQICGRPADSTTKSVCDLPSVISLSAAPLLAGIAHHCDLVDGALRARLVRLHDSATLYLSAGLISYGRRLESRAEDAETFMDEPTLLLDARHALECCVGLLEPSA